MAPRSRRPFSRPDGPGRPGGRRGGPDRFDRPGRAPFRGERGERSDGGEGGERPARFDRPPGRGRFDRFDRQDGRPRGPRNDRFERGPRFERDRDRDQERGRDRDRREPMGAGRDGERRERFGRERFGRPMPGRRDGDGRDGRPGRRFQGSGPRPERPGRFEPRESRDPRDLREQEPPTAESSASPEVDDLVWGLHAAQAALESGRPIHRIWCTPEMRFRSRFLQLLREAKASGVLVEEVTWARLAQLSGGAVHQGIVLQTAAAETLDLDSLIEGCKGIGEAPLLMAVDGLTDPHNLGAIVRSAEALGAHGLVLPQRRNAGLTGSVAKVAAGALEHLPVARVVNLNRALEKLKDSGYRVVGLAEEGSATLVEADLDGPLVVVTGSEGQGLSMLTRRHCDQLIRIPLRGVTPSLNASVATAMLCYEVARRGWMANLKGQDPAPRIQRLRLNTAEPAAVEAAEAPAAEAAVAEAAAAPVLEGDLGGEIRL
ncbi:MAG: 23S rRNA (guanosine(2251)-2'-O)-methyltransferase RlmB [Synechococcus sp.]|nr:23S rRNA (guanosine(2251)-2'-O)-methyltransferase RlmB [Synechococcus sp.]